MRVLDDFLSDDILKKVKDDNGRLRHEPVWRSNISWGRGIVKTSAIVLVRDLGEDDTRSLRAALESKGLFEGKKILTFSCMSYLWTPLSYIPWHNDGVWSGAATVYLNQDWNPDWGGYLLWEKEGEVKASIPKYNRIAINDSNVRHGTSLTTSDAELRETLQMFWTYE